MPAAHEPTDETREMVEAMAAFGIPQEDIAKVLRISENTLRKHYPDELDLGAIKATTKVAQNLFTMATGKGREAVTAAIFWMKTRAGWKETSVVQHTGKDGERLGDLSDDELEHIVREGAKRAAKAEQDGESVH